MGTLVFPVITATGFAFSFKGLMRSSEVACVLRQFKCIVNHFDEQAMTVIYVIL